MGKPVTIYNDGNPIAVGMSGDSNASAASSIIAVFKVDPTGALTTIDYPHHEIHTGNTWAFHHENLAPASGVSTYLHLKTRAGAPHLVLEFEAVGGVLGISISEGATVATAGTVISMTNRNREYASTLSTMVGYTGSTFTTVGTVIATRCLLATSTSQAKSNSVVREGGERIFKPNTDYVINFLPRAASMAFCVDGIFYEE